MSKLDHKFVEDEPRSEFRHSPYGGMRWVGWCAICGGVGYLYGVRGQTLGRWQHKANRNRKFDR